jgi:hypothetical protein
MRKQIAVLVAAALTAAACTDGNPVLAPDADPLMSSGTSGRGIHPTTYEGNFVASDDDQVCYELVALGAIGAVTGEMFGFKIDPPASFGNSYVDFVLSADGKYLDWTSQPSATVLAVIVKGGPNYNLYNYVGSGFTWDTGLHSPMHRRNLPQISHYNVCYERQDGGDAGCTPGYWRNHADRWLGVAPGDDFDTTFDVDAFSPDITLGQAIWLGGGGIDALARHATAGLLNAHGGVPNVPGGETVDYAYTVQEVLDMVKAAIDSGDAALIEATKDLLAAANEAGCPLSGTSAVKVE